MQVILLIFCIGAIAAYPNTLNKVNIVQKDDAAMQTVLNEYNRRGSELCNANSKASWDVQTNVGEPSFEEIYVSNILKRFVECMCSIV